MGRDYRKYKVKAELVNEEYRFWKNREDEIICVMETYKEKRSIYFAVNNLLPSSSLAAEKRKEYRLILMGADEGQIIHKDFGTFFVGISGEGNLFKKFGGPEVTCYTHCILVAAAEGEKPETVISGSMPFFAAGEDIKASKGENKAVKENGEKCEREKVEEKGNEEGSAWQQLWDSALSKNGISNFFSLGKDETNAQWCRMDEYAKLPKNLENCRKYIKCYGHYIIGRKDRQFFVGVPGRFLIRERPMENLDVFALWQPIKGGERYFKNLEQLSGALAEEIFGYWICRIDENTGVLKPM